MTATSRNWVRACGIGLVAVLLVSGLPSPGSGSAVETVSSPYEDTFYDVPTGLRSLPNGKLLDSRRVRTLLPMGATAWQLQYKTTDQHGDPSAYVATVLVPGSPWRGAGPRPLLSYQVAEDGVGLQCTASYALRGGITLPPSNAALEMPLIALAVKRGFAVVVPDYQGPRSEFLGVRGTAHGVLDGIRAARAFDSAGISRRAPIGLMGYSGGSLASMWAALAQPRYAPGLKLAGVAAGGAIADIRATLLKFNGGPLGGALAVAFAGIDRSYPTANLMRYFNREGRAAVRASSSDCLADGVLRHPFANMDNWGVQPGLSKNPGFGRTIGRGSLLLQEGQPRAPVLFYHAVLDELVPIARTRLLAERYCARGVRVRMVESPIGNHMTYMATGVPTALNYLAARFAGHRAPSDC